MSVHLPFHPKIHPIISPELSNKGSSACHRCFFWHRRGSDWSIKSSNGPNLKEIKHPQVLRKILGGASEGEFVRDQYIPTLSG